MSYARFTASNLEGIADAFELFASDQIACMRFQSTQKGKRECEIRAAIWREAADILRSTILTGGDA